ncbi:MAG: SIS domain-containing protein [Clostridia bacterium]|nr:SIS domain-containing protein [Clostridia bacterium]
MKSLFERYPVLETIRTEIEAAYSVLYETFQNGGRLYLCGNGGSAADGEHIVGELMKSFKIRRDVLPETAAALRSYGPYGEELAKGLERGLPAVSLNVHTALSSAYINDRSAEMVYAQQLFVLAKRGDALLAISTSGNSKNCLYAAITAKALGVKVIAMTGQSGGELAGLADVAIKAPAKETYLVQEYHLPIYHALCAKLEEDFFQTKQNQ